MLKKQNGAVIYPIDSQIPGSLLIKNGRVIDPVNKIDEITDLAIEDGCVKAIGRNIENQLSDARVIDARDKWVIPGLMDMHVHLT